MTLPLGVVIAAQEGSPKALETVMEAIAKYVSNATAVLSSTHIDREDLAQDAYVAALEALPRFDPNRGWPLETFLYRHLRGAVLQSAGQYYKGATVPSTSLKRYWSAINRTSSLTEAREWATVDGMEPVTFDAIHNLVSNTWSYVEPGFTDTEDITDTERVDCTLNFWRSYTPDWTDHLVESLDLQELLDGLSIRQRLVIEMSYLAEYPSTDKEIANRLRIGRSSVTRLRHRAITKLKELAQ